jgi:hypothetical protein
MTDSEPYKPATRLRLPLLVLVLLLGAGLLHAVAAIRLNTSLEGGDQGAYLQLSLAQSEGRLLTDGNRHPLYPALLIPLAEREPRFFMRARWVSFAIGTALLVLIAWNEWKKRGDEVAAILAVAFLGAQVQMVRTLSEVWCEPLLYLLAYLLWHQAETLSDDPKQGSLFMRASGLLTGLLYLTKGTGLQVALLFWATVLLLTPKRKQALHGIAVFLVVISPLLYWNLKTYNSPLYSFASTHNMWFDEADEIWYDDPAGLPTFGSYLKTHSLSAVGSRLVRGIGLEAAMTGHILWTDWALPEFVPPLFAAIHTLFKLVVGLIVLAGVAAWKPGPDLASRAGWTFFLLMCLVLIPSFGWYAQLTNEPRFLMTLAPIATVLLARCGSQGIALLQKRVGPPNVQKAFGVSFLVGALAYSALSFSISASFAWKAQSVPPPMVAPLEQRTLASLHQLPENARIAFGPSHGLPAWLARGDLTFRPTPWRSDWDLFQKMLAREGIGFVLLDGETLARRPYLARLGNPSARSEVGWKLLFRDRDAEGFFLLYETGLGH